MIKKILPYYIKVEINIIKQRIIDIFNINRFRYASKKNTEIKYNGNIEIIQEIKQSKTTFAKIKNFHIAIKKIEQIYINPNEIFSFWKTVGRPSKKNGYAESRSIVNGKITNTYGGGLCQMAGIIYYASLFANLEIIERYNHSKDIYTNKTRFTPLGSDATVVFGFKDLKIKNNLNIPIKFSFIIKENKLIVRINSDETIKRNKVKFTKNEAIENEVITTVNGEFKNKSSY
jgi:vancomycin resistance protein VanW